LHGNANDLGGMLSSVATTVHIEGLQRPAIAASMTDKRILSLRFVWEPLEELHCDLAAVWASIDRPLRVDQVGERLGRIKNGGAHESPRMAHRI
jgi:hypothetical protein